jgi:hypothetical protein
MAVWVIAIKVTAIRRRNVGQIEETGLEVVVALAVVLDVARTGIAKDSNWTRGGRCTHGQTCGCK